MITVFDGNQFNRTAETAPIFRYLAAGERAEENVVSRLGIDPVQASPKGDAGRGCIRDGSTNPNEVKVGEPHFRELERAGPLASATGRAPLSGLTACYSS